MINQVTGQFKYTPDQIEGVMWFLNHAREEVMEDDTGQWSNEQAQVLRQFLSAQVGRLAEAR
jgi:hypothetical protein